MLFKFQADADTRPAAPLISEYLYADSLTLIGGYRQTFKTETALALAVTLANGGSRSLGAVKRRSVAWISAKQTPEAVMTSAGRYALQSDSPMAAIRVRSDLHDPKVFSKLLTQLERLLAHYDATQRLGLVVFDDIQLLFRGAAMHRDVDASAVADSLRRVLALADAVLITGSSQSLNGAACGSQAFEASCDIVYRMSGRWRRESDVSYPEHNTEAHLRPFYNLHEPIGHGMGVEWITGADRLRMASPDDDECAQPDAPCPVDLSRYEVFKHLVQTYAGLPVGDIKAPHRSSGSPLGKAQKHNLRQDMEELLKIRIKESGDSQAIQRMLSRYGDLLKQKVSDYEGGHFDLNEETDI